MWSQAAEINAFSINGLEFDLDEFDLYEQRLNAKRLLQPKKREQSLDEADDLDEYLNKLVIDGKASKFIDSPGNACSASIASVSNPSFSKETEQSASTSILPTPSVPFPVLLYWMVGLLVFVNSVTKPLPVPECKPNETDLYPILITFLLL